MIWHFPVHITGTRAEISMSLKQGKKCNQNRRKLYYVNSFPVMTAGIYLWSNSTLQFSCKGLQWKDCKNVWKKRKKKNIRYIAPLNFIIQVLIQSTPHFHYFFFLWPKMASFQSTWVIELTALNFIYEYLCCKKGVLRLSIMFQVVYNSCTSCCSILLYTANDSTDQN